jgi:hypothetical protein
MFLVYRLMTTIMVGIQNSILVLDSSNGYNRVRSGELKVSHAFELLC